MKNLQKNLIRYFFISGLLFLTLGFYGCSDDDDVLPDPFVTEATITVEDQVVAQNMITIEEVMVDEDAWIVIRKVNDDGTFTDIIADPEFLDEGTHNDIMIELEPEGVDLQDGDTLVVQVHRDDDDGIFDFEEDPAIDEPFEDEFGAPVAETFQITSPSFTVSDQTVVDNTVTFDTVTTLNGGFIVLHDQTAEGTIDEDDIIGWQYVPAGVLEDVTVTFDSGFTYVQGQTIYPRLYSDNPADETFTFLTDPDQDIPMIFGFDDDNTITASFVVD